MRLTSFILSFLMLGVLSNKHDNHALSSAPSRVEATCAYPNGRLLPKASEPATCYGHNPCNVCTNCSKCGHCSGGGSCGVCSSGSRKSSFQKNGIDSSPNSGSGTGEGNSTRSNNNTAQFYSHSDVPSTLNVYLPALATVSAATLNVRRGPGTEYEVLIQLAEGDNVTITAIASDNWVKVEFDVWDGSKTFTLEGYVVKKYLLF